MEYTWEHGLQVLDFLGVTLNGPDRSDFWFYWESPRYRFIGHHTPLEKKDRFFLWKVQEIYTEAMVEDAESARGEEIRRWELLTDHPNYDKLYAALERGVPLDDILAKNKDSEEV